VLIDGGNSYYKDDIRRAERLAKRGVRYLDVGTSGGVWGLERGYCLMIGGEGQSVQGLRPVFEALAPGLGEAPRTAGRAGDPAPEEQGWLHCGPAGAGHFVKMVHNGIEYGDMQLIAESATLLRSGLGLAPERVAGVFSAWNEGELESFLVEITADIFRVKDPRDPEALLLDAVLDRAGQKGTGRWTVIAAAELGVAIPTIAAAVDARTVSADKSLRERVEPVLGGARAALEGVSVDDVRDALYAAKITSYAQGFALLARASVDKGYGTNLGEVARIWTAGCIIRARFLDRVTAAFAIPDLPSLVLAPDFAKELRRRLPAWRRVVSASVRAGLPTPGFATSLAWLDGVATARGSASVLQAQRDYFGAHGYERVDEPGVAQHTEWKKLARND
jgi:6-phosphogluconate dehydrogenase